MFALRKIIPAFNNLLLITSTLTEVFILHYLHTYIFYIYLYILKGRSQNLNPKAELL